jgi:hypothetical protein
LVFNKFPFYFWVLDGSSKNLRGKNRNNVEKDSDGGIGKVLAISM